MLRDSPLQFRFLPFQQIAKPVCGDDQRPGCRRTVQHGAIPRGNRNPVFPGVLLLEAMAQAAGILGFVTAGKTIADGSTFYFAGADQLRFKRPCVPGDRIMLQASIVSERRGIWKFDVSSNVDGELAASATILCADR